MKLKMMNTITLSIRFQMKKININLSNKKYNNWVKKDKQNKKVKKKIKKNKNKMQKVMKINYKYKKKNKIYY